MKKLRIRYLTIVIVVAVSTWVLLVACGGAPGTDQIPIPEPTAATEAFQTVSMLVPPDAVAVFNFVSAIAERSGPPYLVQIMASDLVEPGVNAVLEGKIDLMLVMRRPLPDEPVAFLELFHTPVVIFVNPKLGINNLECEQVAAIFSGEVTNWSQVGGPNIEIMIFVQEDSDGATIALKNYLLGDRQFTESAQVLFGDRDVISVVNGLPGAVGYSSLATKKLIEESASGALAVEVSLGGLYSDDLNYPIRASVGFIYLPERQADLQPLLDWTTGFLDSEMGQLLQQQYGANSVTSPNVESESGNNAYQD